MANTGIIFDIKKFSIHDGPGIRTTIFFKGCPLRCWWCHNPESQARSPQLLLRPQRCVECGACVEVCPQNAISRNGRLVTDLANCTACGACVAVCYAEARELVGRTATTAEVLDVIERDHPFYDESGGGVTFSGGEPLAQPDFLLELLQACQSREIHTAVDTCGYVPWESLNRIRPYVDVFLYDLKHLDDQRHQALTGVGNALILSNLQRLADAGQAVIVRVPLIPGLNDAPEHIARLGRFVADLPGVVRLDLLPYHTIAEEKYRRLGLEYRMPAVSPPSAAHMQTLAARLQTYGLEVRVGG
ncbi:MAG: glycyl-radical enzyme activating protein [Anaerolineae bacterium]|nr:glycyl-radical enzyme activating protein [Anaerolineae bacterium]